MIQEFPNWYKIVELDPPKGKLSDRWTGIENFSSKVSRNDIIKLVLLHFGTQFDDDEFITSFVNVFSETDDTFTYQSNTAELRLLAGAVLIDLLTKSKD